MSSNEKKPCLYALHSYCIVYSNLKKEGKEVDNWGSEDWIKLHCSMCVKAVYARAKARLVKGFSVVNTL